MIPSFVVGNSIDLNKYSRSTNHYESMEQAINWIGQSATVQKSKCQTFDVLFNNSLKRAMFAVSIAYPKKPTSRTILAQDIHNRVKAISTGIKAARSFFNQPEFVDYTVVFSIGAFNHEACLFMRKNTDRSYNSILFNPSAESHLRNAENFLDKFTIHLRRSYNAADGNDSGQCSAYTWKTISDYILGNMTDPFECNDLLTYNKTTRMYV